MKKITVGILFGGRSGEHEVSRNSAQAIANNFDKDKYNVIPIGVTKDGQWYAPIKLEDIANFVPDNYQGYQVTILPQPNNRKLVKLNDWQPIAELDVIFPIIHGTYGEDGTLQGLLEMANIPYVGAGVLGSAVGMDKIIMKKILAANNLPQVKFVHILRSQLENMPEVVESITNQLDFPVFVKPANLGSSVGISKAKNKEELEIALKKASLYDRRIIIEEGKEVREIEVSVLGNEKPIVSLPGEIIPCNEFYDYKAKYIDDKSELQIPAQLPEKTIQEVQKLAIEVFLALDCAGFARIDFFIEKETGKIFINEINTLPGFTSISMYPKLLEHDGIPMPQLLDKLIELAFNRYEEKNKNLTIYSE